MSALRQIGRLFLFCIACVFALLASAAPPDERARQVLESLLLHLLADPKFDMTRVSTNGTTIVLHTQTPGKTGFLMAEQIRVEIGNRALPGDAEQDMRRRNDSVMASYTNMKFAGGIAVTNLAEIWKKGRRSIVAFQNEHPKACGWLESYLPGYSKNGTRAVVRAGVGPWVHGAMLTAVLEKRRDKWVVAWYHVARFA